MLITSAIQFKAFLVKKSCLLSIFNMQKTEFYLLRKMKTTSNYIRNKLYSYEIQLYMQIIFQGNICV